MGVSARGGGSVAATSGDTMASPSGNLMYLKSVYPVVNAAESSEHLLTGATVVYPQGLEQRLGHQTPHGHNYTASPINVPLTRPQVGINNMTYCLVICCNYFLPFQ